MTLVLLSEIHHVGFLSNLVKVFPSLATRPLFLTGESYAGTYIDCASADESATAVYHQAHLPDTETACHPYKITIGDGLLGSQTKPLNDLQLNVIELYPALIDYNQQMFEFLHEQTHLCGFDLNLTYLQNSTFPILNLTQPTENSVLSESLLNPTRDRARTLHELASARFAELHGWDALSKQPEFHQQGEAGKWDD
ncbi:hypothetical protein DFH08DRAFT_808561 [Mycena albidolilacea]|uniref:Carboxypeptidase n=1 Tax=Mycena albidolilacea TaxID=1033008 RepID=A0AAD7A2X3_9AGAR|nr:hypothetical protein DFH08DRAFT_808561 [Mycena albidolilacea]